MRRVREGEYPSNLFQQLAVLVGMMGSLIIPLLALTRLAQTNRDEERKASAPIAVPHEEYKPKPLPPLPELVTFDELPPLPEDVVAPIIPDKLPDLLPLVDPRSEAIAKLDSTKKQLAEVKNLTATVPAIERSRLDLLSDHLARLKAQFRQIQVDRAKYEDENKDAQKELDTVRKLKIDAERRSKHVENRYAIVPYSGPNGTARRPIYLECRKTGITLQPEGVVLDVELFSRAGEENNPLAILIRALINELKTDGKDGVPYPLLLVRPDGITGYYVAQRALSKVGVPVGYELISDDVELAFDNPDPKQQAIAETVLAALRQQQMAPVDAPSVMASRGPYSGGAGSYTSGGQGRPGGKPGVGALRGARPGSGTYPAAPNSTTLPGSAVPGISNAATGAFGGQPAAASALGSGTPGGGIPAPGSAIGGSAAAGGNSFAGSATGAGGVGAPNGSSGSMISSGGATSLPGLGPALTNKGGAVSGPLAGDPGNGDPGLGGAPNLGGANNSGAPLMPPLTGGAYAANTGGAQSGDGTMASTTSSGQPADPPAGIPNKADGSPGLPGASGREANGDELPAYSLGRPLGTSAAGSDSAGMKNPSEIELAPDGGRLPAEPQLEENSGLASQTIQAPAGSKPSLLGDEDPESLIQPNAAPFSAVAENRRSTWVSQPQAKPNRLTFDELVLTNRPRSSNETTAIEENDSPPDFGPQGQGQGDETGGREMAMPGLRMAQRSMKREVTIECRADGIMLLPEKRFIPLESDRQLPVALAEVYRHVLRQVSRWEQPGPYYRWQPVLRMRVQPDAVKNYYTLRMALVGSRVEVEREPAEDESLWDLTKRSLRPGWGTVKF